MSDASTPVLSVFVVGGPGSGKTTVAHMVAAMLRTYGIVVEVKDRDGPDPSKERYDRVLRSMHERGTRVVVETMQTPPLPNAKARKP